ncbi:MAG: ABC transporter permease [Planctomycetota bacterium]|jgi:putative ABC transport system permease protein
MNNSVHTIQFLNLILAFIPAIAVVGILWKWGLGYGNSLYAIFRMLIQLLMIGYFLIFIFKSDSYLIVVGVLAIMLFVSSWIALRTVKIPRRVLYLKSFCSISVGGGVILLLITQGVLNLQPWYLPSYVVPLAGMIFASAMNSVSIAVVASAMNSVSIAVERLNAEVERDVPYEKARIIALRASLIPITNSLFAVGLVSLPGMMTGQILSGVSPFIAARYQIMVMCMIFGSAGISSACFLALVRSNFVNGKQEEFMGTT